MVTGEDCVCWPFWSGCENARAHLSPALLRGLVLSYIALGVVASALFALRHARAALGVFAGATLLGAALYALDYRLRMNQTYMLSWVVLAFLAIPRKAEVLQALVALFYVWAGTLKLNREWVTGAALYEQPFLVPRALTTAACVYVLVLEIALVWGLFSGRPRWRWAVYAQLMLFHAVSWKVVGYFYPLLMFGLTAIYPLVWLLEPDRTLTWARLRAREGPRVAVAATAGVFSAFQLVPHLFPGDTAVTGEGRLFALHMFDSRVECAGGATLRSASGMPRARVELITEDADARTRCDPIVLAAQAHRLCRLLAARPSPSRVDVAIDAKRSSDPATRPLIRVEDFCHKDIEYSPWRHNEWIEAR